GDKAEFVVGTEIVNLVEEYTPLAIGIGDREFETSWPDDIKEGPPAATVGGVSAAPPSQNANTGPNLVGKAKEDPPPEDEETSQDTSDDIGTGVATGGTETDTTEDEAGRRSPGLMIAGIAIVAALLAGAAYWFLTQENEPVVAESEEPPVEEPVEEPAAVAEPAPDNPCSDAALAGVVTEGYGTMLDRLASCGNAVSVDTALGMIETGVDANDPAALAALGRLYDEASVIDGIETNMGLTFADNPARAAEYYSRAVTAGDGVGAAEALTAICERLATATDTLSEGATQDFCAQ
ncbi:MAG: hypothetical protein AAGA05_12040, partial [Pseudomonadota bacterium]